MRLAALGPVGHILTRGEVPERCHSLGVSHASVALLCVTRCVNASRARLRAWYLCPMTAKHVAALGSLLVFGACAQSGAAPLRSPALDYQAPAARTADGDVVGADREAPSDKLSEGPSNAGVAPGWKVDKNGVAYDPKRHVGGTTEPPQSAPANPSQK